MEAACRGYLQKMADGHTSGAQLFLLIVPAPLGTVLLATSTLWPLAFVTGVASIIAALWGTRRYRNEQADEVIRGLDENAEPSGPDDPSRAGREER